MKNFSWICFVSLCYVFNPAQSLKAQSPYHEMHRPQVHFSPKENWMNDPNGMVYLNGVYHLFFQYYPGATVWGPMHWGHAVSKDLVHWQELPIALYPDSLGYIFSGSIVADLQNTSGFGKNGKTPLVAIFTQHDPIGEKKGTIDFQNQGIAYSLDEGKTWTKYTKNPVVKNPGIRDFRDPKVSWYEPGKKWIMTLATKDRVTFYSSHNLTEWKKESTFGEKLGSHGGVWECPDLFPLNYQDQQLWVLLSSINPGGPNKGSATQYFIGKFNGNEFTPIQDFTEPQWIDYGADDYAGVTWSNTGSRKIFLGWMSNWNYATIVPTEKWRSAMTIPRELTIKKPGNRFLLASEPVKEFASIFEKPIVFADKILDNFDLSKEAGKINGPAVLHIHSAQIKNFSVNLSNMKGEELILGYDATNNSFYINRTKSGKTDFEKSFPARHTAPRFATTKETDFVLVIDNASVEMFADNGLTVMTDIFFPGEDYSRLRIQSPAHFTASKISFNRLKPIWDNR